VIHSWACIANETIIRRAWGLYKAYPQYVLASVNLQQAWKGFENYTGLALIQRLFSMLLC